MLTVHGLLGAVTTPRSVGTLHRFMHVRLVDSRAYVAKAVWDE